MLAPEKILAVNTINDIVVTKEITCNIKIANTSFFKKYKLRKDFKLFKLIIKPPFCFFYIYNKKSKEVGQKRLIWLKINIKEVEIFVYKI